MPNLNKALLEEAKFWEGLIESARLTETEEVLQRMEAAKQLVLTKLSQNALEETDKPKPNSSIN